MLKKAEVDLNKLSELRKEHGYSISFVSSYLGYKTPTGYWLIEKGQRQANVSTLYFLSKLYAVPMEDLIIEEK